MYYFRIRPKTTNDVSQDTGVGVFLSKFQREINHYKGKLGNTLFNPV